MSMEDDGRLSYQGMLSTDGGEWVRFNDIEAALTARTQALDQLQATVQNSLPSLDREGARRFPNPYVIGDVAARLRARLQEIADAARVSRAPHQEPDDLQHENVVLHNTCGHYEEEIARLKTQLAALLPALVALQDLIVAMRRDADAHRREAAAFRRLREVAIRPACVCEDVLAQVHEYFADQLAAALQGSAPQP